MNEPYEKVFDESMRLNMLSEIIPPQAVADMAVYLAGPGGTYVTGQAINVCAGLSVH
jgi:NAD(P)-dependent dehydrogenase (short-subunit alcohol dehydrogenase family)